MNQTLHWTEDGEYNWSMSTCVYWLCIGDPVPEEEEEPERQNHDWAWLPLFAALTTLAYLWTPKQDPIPEVSFPFFLQHMLYTGEV